MTNVTNGGGGFRSGSVTNTGGMLLPEKIIREVTTLNGLFPRVFGELTEDVVYDREAEFCRRALREIYQFSDSDKIFPKVLDRKRFFGTLETLFRYMRPADNQQPR